VKHIFELLWCDKGEDRLLGPLVSQGLRNNTYTVIANTVMYGCRMLELRQLYGKDVPGAHMIANVKSPWGIPYRHNVLS
jgi:hypothetical protein